MVSDFSLLVKCLLISALTPLALATLPLFELVDGVAEFLHGERRHCVLQLIVVVLVCVLELIVELREHICNACPSYLLVPVLCCMGIMSTFLRLDLMEVEFVRPRKLLQMPASSCLLSSFLIVRIFSLIVFFFCLSVYIWCCVAFPFELS